MMSVESGPGKGGGKPPGPPGQGKGRKEDWIGNQLRRVYDEALQELIPEDMLRLLDQLDSSEEQED